MIQRRIVFLSAAGLASALFLAACDGSAGMTSSGTSPAGAAPAASPSSSVSRPAAVDLTVRTVSGLGSVVADGDGMTLYRYAKDQAHPSRWTCAEECTRTWKPFIVRGPVRTSGVDKSLLGTVHRDGRTQLTLAGWPLYRYAGDTTAGQANGQDREGMWHTVSPSGI